MGYMVNPTLHANKAFRYQVEKLLKYIFHSSTQSGITKLPKKENTCVIALLMFYDNRTTNTMKFCRVLSCAVYYVIYICFGIDYLGCQYKK